jgi:hypothetical protein
MVNRRLLLASGLAACVPFAKLSAQVFAVPTYQDTELMLGETSVIVQSLSNGLGPHFFHPHENEATSLRVAEHMVLRHGGICVSLHHGGGRRIIFELDGKKYSCDPNRIFTREGTWLTLGNAPQHVCDAVDILAAKIADVVLKGMTSHSVVVGMHNNTPGGYSVLSYGAGGNMYMDAEAVFVNTARDADDFFLTTERHFFDALKSLHHNVVLQKTPPQHNDGSFSVFCAQKNIPYVNIEAQDAHGAMQARMLRELVAILSPKAA